MWSIFPTTSKQRNVFCALAAVVLAASIPHTGLAMSNSEAGLWKVTKQSLGPYSGRIVIERVKKGEAVANGTTFLVIRKGKAYLATPSTLASAGGATAIDYSAWSDMKLEAIGTNVRAIDDCGARCQHGFHGDRMTVTFKTIKKQGQPEQGVVALKEEQ